MLHFPGHEPLCFARPTRAFTAQRIEEVRDVIDVAAAAARAGSHVVGFVSYDAAPAFESAMEIPGRSPLPLASFAAFDTDSVSHEPLRTGGDQPQLHGEWLPNMSAPEFIAAVERVRDGVGRGDFYQVNLTLRLRAAGISPAALWTQLCRAQPGAYHTWLDLGKHAIVSASPELFFERRGNELLMRPMKGTSRRGRWLAEDDDMARALALSGKERAENLMIVDLVRNDLGRMAAVGSVRVPELCAVERWPTVLQMTSTVVATLRDGTSTSDVFAALFPCGSVTGAPKIAAMRAISAEEAEPRGVYCGAIGWLRPGGDAVFSVAIRTAWLDVARGVAEYGAGGGITWDSRPDAEHAETMLKARILVAPPVPDFQLVETLHLDGMRYVRLRRHLARMAESARYFGFRDPTRVARAALHRARRPGRWRVRLVADRGGAVTCELEEMPERRPGPVPLAFATRPVSSSNPFVFHKTTHRAAYDANPWALHRNERGELTEFTIGNLVVELEGRRYTPPRDCGLLAGVFRQELMDRGRVSERVLHEPDLRRATRIWLVNSLREWEEVT